MRKLVGFICLLATAFLVVEMYRVNPAYAAEMSGGKIHPWMIYSILGGMAGMYAIATHEFLRGG